MGINTIQVNRCGKGTVKYRRCVRKANKHAQL